MAGAGDVKPDITKHQSGASQPDEDAKRSYESLNIRVRNADGAIVQFKCKPTTAFEKLMKAYCGKLGMSSKAIRFIFDGHRLDPGDTPAKYEMEDMDIVRCSSYFAGVHNSDSEGRSVACASCSASPFR